MKLFDQQTLDLTFKASNEGIWDWIVGEENVYYSNRALAFMGREGDAPNLMTHPEELLHEEDVAYFSNILTLTLMDSDEEFFAIDCRVVRLDKSICWLRIRGTVVWENDKAVRIAGSMIDISRRKCAERQISEERNMLRLVIDNIPLQVYFKNTESCYMLVNQRQAEWLGVASPDELVGKSAEDYFSEESWLKTRQEELRIMETGEPVIDEVQCENWPDRPATYVKKNKYPWYNSAGQLLGTYGISCDVTKLVLAQQSLEDMAMALQSIHTKHEEELSLAKEMQFAILPENATDWNDVIKYWKPRVNIEHLHIPAADLAGDYYDVITIDDDRLGILILDVMGHGIRSALIVSLIQGLLEDALPLAGNPAAFISKLNGSLSVILAKTSVTLFATACYAVVDFKNDEVAITTAGHDAPLIQFGSYRKLAKVAQEPALGFFPETQYTATKIPLQEIEKMEFFTDGIYEASNGDGEEWGIERFNEAFSDCEAMSIRATHDEIFRRASKWLGDEGFDDDVCLLGVVMKQNKQG